MKKLAFFFVVGLLGVTGCAKYRPHEFQTQHHNNNTGKVEITAHVLSESDSQYYFGRRILARGYQPILLSINNPTVHSFMLDAHDIEMQIEDAKTIARAIKFHPDARFLDWVFLCSIAACVDSIKATEANKSLTNDLNQRTISSDSYIQIRAHTTCNKALFIKRGTIPQKIKLILTNRSSNEKISFNVIVK